MSAALALHREVQHAATALPALPSVRALAPADYARPATDVQAMAVLSRLRVDLGWRTTADHLAAIADRLVERGYTLAALVHAGAELAFDEQVTRALRYPEGSVTPADFERVISGNGPARKGRLYTHAEMLERINRTGQTTAAYAMVSAEDAGTDAPRWRER